MSERLKLTSVICASAVLVVAVVATAACISSIYAPHRERADIACIKAGGVWISYTASCSAGGTAHDAG